MSSVGGVDPVLSDKRVQKKLLELSRTMAEVMAEKMRERLLEAMDPTAKEPTAGTEKPKPPLPPSPRAANARRRRGLPAKPPEEIPKGDDSERLTTTQVAALLGIHRSLLDYYQKKGQGPPFDMVDGRRSYKRKDIDKWWRPILKARTKGDAKG